MNDHEQSKLMRQTDGNETILIRRMFGVGNRYVSPVAEDFHCLEKSYSMLPSVGSRLAVVPIKRSRHIKCSCTSGLDVSSLSPISTNDRKRVVSSPGSRSPRPSWMRAMTSPALTWSPVLRSNITPAA